MPQLMVNTWSGEHSVSVSAHLGMAATHLIFQIRHDAHMLDDADASMSTNPDRSPLRHLPQLGMTCTCCCNPRAHLFTTLFQLL